MHWVRRQTPFIRSLIKTASYKLFTTLAAFLAALVYCDWHTAWKAAVGDLGVKLVIYLVHERLWSHLVLDSKWTEALPEFELHWVELFAHPQDAQLA